MLAIIGGTGLYELPGMVIDARLDAPTPFGAPSGVISQGRVGHHGVLFLARHGTGHRLLPHEVNYRANIYALKRAGATQILSFSAVGSLAEAIAPGHLAMPDQYFDWTKGDRKRTFFGDGVAAHVSTARPVSANLIDWVAAGVQQHAARHPSQAPITLHRDVTYACVEGPRLGTRAESLFMQGAGCQLVGMTNVPEVFLAREAQMGYATIGIVTDYDCWMEDPSKHVTVSSMLALYRQSIAAARALLETLLTGPLPTPEPEIRSALEHALMTPEDQLTAAQSEWFSVLRR
ncbi:MAG: MTAP family purine nucleoside phosphorylase [Pseudomonadota bacterium]|nr:MTAP family purine nucleoside phosphorylase [Pseudomonadota bacterium]